jgi:hypothetical protein
MATNPSSTTSLQLPSIVNPETNQIVARGRCKTPGDLVSAWTSLWWADLESSEFRMRAQQWRDGMAPYSPRKEALMGTAGRTNVNWGLGDQIALDAEMPYNDLLDGVDTLFTMPTNWGVMSDRLYVEQVMAEEITRMLRSWPQFDPLYQLNVRLFVNEGVSFTFHEDDYTWPWEVVGLQHIVFPRRIKANINEIDIIVAKRELLPYKLYQKCANEDQSASEGWNRDATWEAIKTAAQPTLQSNDFQEWEMAWKNHDYILGQTAVTVPVIEGWVREVDGTVSHYIAREDGKGEFLYKKEGKYKDMGRMLTAFLYGVGANGTFHSIHGVLQKTFAAGMAQNKLICRALDMGIHSSTPYLMCSSEESLTELPLTPLGQYVAMAPGYSWGEMKVPAFEQSLMPLLGTVSELLSSRSRPYTASANNVNRSTSPKTKYQVQSEDETQARLSSSGVTLFKNGLRNHYCEVVRRVIQKPYPQSWVGGPEVQEFRARCISRGVPEAAIDMVDVKRLEVNMGIGRGSAAARRVAADALNVLYPRADAKGQNLINYVVASSYAGASIAREVFPPEPGTRPPQAYEDAKNENAAISATVSLGLPNPINVEGNQNHAVHLDAHIPFLTALDEQIYTQAAPLEKIIPPLEALVAHSEEHIEMMDATLPHRAVYNEAIKKFRMVATNGARELQRLQEKAQRELQHNGVIGADGQPTMPGTNGMMPDGSMPDMSVPPSLLIDSAEAAEKARGIRVKTDLEVERFMREEARQDAITAAKIAREGLPPSTVP